MILMLLMGFLTLVGLGIMFVFAVKLVKFLAYTIRHAGELKDAFKEGAGLKEADTDVDKTVK